MEQKNFAALQTVLLNNRCKDFDLILEKVQKSVPAVRACYDTFLHSDNVSLAWVFAIDGLYLLNVFDEYKKGIIFSGDFLIQVMKVDLMKRLLAQDMMMVENQIPFTVLKEIAAVLYPSQGYEFTPLVMYRTFILIHSPFELCHPFQAPTVHVHHLLHYMYQSIVVKKRSQPPPKPKSKSEYRVGSPGSAVQNIIDSTTHVSDFVKKVPVKEISRIYEQTITTLETFTKKKTTIPSASKLERRTGFRFSDLQKDEGIPNIRINQEIFYLPCVTLTTDSEVILRNLVAYETLMPKTDKFPLTEYVGLLCGLIVSEDDVKVLKKSGIIKGDLGDDEIVKLFVGMSSSILSLKSKEKSNLQIAIDQVNEVYESRPLMKVYFVGKKLASWLLVLLTAIGSFVGATWKIVAFMVSILSVFMLTYQAYCEVYGCDKTNVKLLSYASS